MLSSVGPLGHVGEACRAGDVVLDVGALEVAVLVVVPAQRVAVVEVAQMQHAASLGAEVQVMADPRLERPEWRGRTNVDALTIACIERAEAIAGHQFTITQGSYQSGGGDLNSAGTHDRGGVVDFKWCRHNRCVRALRKAGMAAWHRTPAQGPWGDHIHAVVIGHPDLAPSAARQVESYKNRRDGLKGNGPDDGPQLSPIPLPVWPYPPEDDMAQYDPLLKGMDAKLDRLIDAQEKSRTREKKTNLLLRRLRAQVTDLATQIEIDNLLADEE